METVTSTDLISCQSHYKCLGETGKENWESVGASFMKWDQKTSFLVPRTNYFYAPGIAMETVTSTDLISCQSLYQCLGETGKENWESVGASFLKWEQKTSSSDPRTSLITFTPWHCHGNVNIHIQYMTLRDTWGKLEVIRCLISSWSEGLKHVVTFPELINVILYCCLGNGWSMWYSVVLFESSETGNTIWWRSDVPSLYW